LRKDFAGKFELQHHDGDEDGDDAIHESLDAPGTREILDLRGQAILQNGA